MVYRVWSGCHKHWSWPHLVSISAQETIFLAHQPPRPNSAVIPLCPECFVTKWRQTGVFSTSSSCCWSSCWTARPPCPPPSCPASPSASLTCPLLASTRRRRRRGRRRRRNQRWRKSFKFWDWEIQHWQEDGDGRQVTSSFDACFWGLLRWGIMCWGDFLFKGSL